MKLLTMLLGMLLLLTTSLAAQSSYNLRSPDGNIDVRVRVSDRVRYDLALRGNLLLRDATMSLTVDGKTLGKQPKVTAAKPSSHDEIVEPGGQIKVRENPRALQRTPPRLRRQLRCDLPCCTDYGVAYRFETSLPAQQVIINNEEALFTFSSEYKVYYPAEDSFYSHNERFYTPMQMHDLGPKTIASLPAIVSAGDDVKIAIGESGLDDYPGLWLRGTDGPALTATFPPYPLKGSRPAIATSKSSKPPNYIAKTKGTRTFPWRVLGIAVHDGDLITNPLVYLLQRRPNSRYVLDPSRQGRVGLVERQ